MHRELVIECKERKGEKKILEKGERERERDRQIERQRPTVVKERQRPTVVKRETETYSGKKKREMVVYREIGRETVVYREIGRETWSKQDEESLVTRVKEIWSNR